MRAAVAMTGLDLQMRARTAGPGRGRRSGGRHYRTALTAERARRRPGSGGRRAWPSTRASYPPRSAIASLQHAGAELASASGPRDRRRWSVVLGAVEEPKVELQARPLRPHQEGAP